MMAWLFVMNFLKPGNALNYCKASSLREKAMAFVKARGGGFGMDAELAAKRLANFDTNLANVAIIWLCQLSNTPKFSVEQMWAGIFCALQPTDSKPVLAPG
jgi:hypothetical protein